jgi:hypothetical protein
MFFGLGEVASGEDERLVKVKRPEVRPATRKTIRGNGTRPEDDRRPPPREREREHPASSLDFASSLCKCVLVA